MKTLFIHNIKKSAAAIAGYCIILFLGLMLASALTGGIFWGEKDLNWFNEFASVSIMGSIYVAFIISFFTALSLFSYLQKSNSCSFFHALPLKRSRILSNNIFSGLLIMYVPNILAFIIVLIYSCFKGVNSLKPMGLWLLIICLEELVMYLIAVLSFIVMGTVVSSIALYCVISFGGYFALFILSVILEVFTFGYEFYLNDFGIMRYVSPIFFYNSIIVDDAFSGNDFSVLKVNNLSSVILISLFSAAVLLVLCFWAYKKRHSENSENIIALDFMKKVIAVVVAAIGTGFITMILLGDFYDNNFPAKYSSGVKIFLIVHFLVYGFIIYSAVWIIIEKDIRIFKKRVIRSLIFAGVMALTAVGIIILSGYLENYTPERGEISRMAINGDEDMIAAENDSELIDDMVDLNKYIISLKNDTAVISEPDYSIDFYYFMKDGNVISRRYIIRRESVQEKTDELKRDNLVQLCLHPCEYTEARISIGGYSSIISTTDKEKVSVLYNAVKDDLENGRTTFDEMVKPRDYRYESIAYDNIVEYVSEDDDSVNPCFSIVFCEAGGESIYLEGHLMNASEICWINEGCTSTWNTCRELFGDGFIKSLIESGEDYDFD